MRRKGNELFDKGVTMKRIMKVLPIMIVLVLAISILGFSAVADTTVAVETRPSLYIGEYEVDSHSGEAHIVFGYTSNTSAEFGVIITDSENRQFLFKGDSARIDQSGKFGIAIYELPDGDYFAQAYSGAGDARTLGNKVPFTKGVSSYTVEFDLADGEGTIPTDQIVAQGGNAEKPDVVPTHDSGRPFVGWVNADGSPFDYTAPVYENTTVYAQYEKAEEVKDPVYTLDFASNGGGAYFGNAVGADLTGGKSLVLEFNFASAIPAKNLSVGFLMMDHSGSGNNYPYSVGKSAGWYTNYNYFDSRHVWAGAMSKDNMIANGAVFHENLFHMEDIFTAETRIKAVYTSYTDTTGASIAIYTKPIGADDSEYVFQTSVTNIPKAAVPDEKSVYLHWLMLGGVHDITSIHQTVSEYRVTIVDGNTKTDVTTLATGPNAIMKNIYTKIAPSVQYEVTYDNYTVGSNSSYFNGWFGNYNGVSLAEGESLAMQFDVDESKTANGRNVNIAFVVNDSDFGTATPYSVSGDTTAFMLYGNHVMSGQPACYAGNNTSGTKSGVFNCADIYKEGNTVKAVYTYSATGSSLKVYYKTATAEEFTETCSITGITGGAHENVHLYTLHDSSQWANNQVRYVISNYTIQKSDGTQVDRDGISNNCNFGVYGQDEGGVNKALTIQGNMVNGQEGGISWIINKEMTATDSLTFDVLKADAFKVVVDYDLDVTDVSAIVLSVDNVEYKHYKLYFDGKYVTLAGRNASDAVWETVVKRGYQMDRFYAGIRMTSSTTKASSGIFDNVAYTIRGDVYEYNFNSGMPNCFSSFTDGKISNAYILDEEYEIRYALYDGTLLETQTVGHGTSATLPEGNWVNESDVLKKIAFVENDQVIFLIREGDNLGGNYVSVENGTIVTENAWFDNFAVFKKGDSVTITAEDGAYAFAGWSDGNAIVSTDKTYTFNVNKNVKLTATYDIPKYTVTVVNGAIDGITADSAEIAQGTNITVIADDVASKLFAGWSNGTEIVSNDRNYSFTVTADVTLTATYTDAYTVTFDLSAVGGENSEEILTEAGTVSAPSTAGIDAAPTNSVLVWVGEDGSVWDFNTVITQDTVIRAIWGSVDITDTIYSLDATQGNAGFGLVAPVDVSDGSTVNIEIDVLEANVPQSNYNAYVWIRSDNFNYGQWAGYYFYQYGNYAYYSPWVGHYGTQNNLTATGVDNGTGWNPCLWYVKDQSVKFSYTAPTENTTGAIRVYTKHITQDESGYVLVSETTNLTLANVQNTANVYMGIAFDSHVSFTFKGYNSWIDRVGGGKEPTPGMGIYRGAISENTEYVYVEPTTWGSGKTINYRANTDATVDKGGSFQMWMGNAVGVDLAEGESLTWEFRVADVEYGLWYNVWSGITVNSGAFPSSLPQSYGAAIGFYGNFALDTSNYSGRYATICGDTNYYAGATLTDGYDCFDPYTDMCLYPSGELDVKIVYTSYDKTNNVPGSIVFYKKASTEGAYTKVTEITNITKEMYDDIHIVWWHNSSQNAGGGFDFLLENFNYYTSNDQALAKAIGVGGAQGQVADVTNA